MDFPKVTLEEFAAKLAEISSVWQDETALNALALITAFSTRFESKRFAAEHVEALLREDIGYLNVFRLLLDSSQDQLANKLGFPGGFSGLKSKTRRSPDKVASSLVAQGLVDAAIRQLAQRWTLADVLADRYKQGRGRAVGGQKRGRALEDFVAKVLETVGCRFDKRCTFVGRDGKKAKADFAIPSKNHPRIVVEVKGYEATGSKQTDVLGDILKIIDAKEYRMYFLLVTDGRGWRNRASDLRKIIDQQNRQNIDMVYTMADLPTFETDIRRILAE